MGYWFDPGAHRMAPHWLDPPAAIRFERIGELWNRFQGPVVVHQ